MRNDPEQAAIERLVYQYAERIDAGDFAGVGGLFRHGVIVTEDSSVLAGGADEVERLYHRTTRLYEDDGTPHTKHVTTNVIIDLDGSAGRATARSYFTVFQAVTLRSGAEQPIGTGAGGRRRSDAGGASVSADFPLQAIIAGRYHDSFERIDSAWWFRERKMLPDLFGDLSHHLLIGL